VINMTNEILASRDALQMLLAIENYDLEEFESLWQKYQHALTRYCESAVRADPDLLQGELTWVQQVIKQVTQERAAISYQLVSLQNGRKAVDQYGRFPAE